MADHVHPSVRGQYLLARTIVSAMDHLLPAEAMDLGRLRGEEEYRRLLGDLPVERVRVDQAMARLLAEKPMERHNGHNARAFARRAAAGWQALSEPERAGARKWSEHRDEVPLVLDVADQLFLARDLAGARRHYAASLREAPFTPRGDLWAVVQEAWSARLLGEAMSPVRRRGLRAALERAEFVARAPDIDPFFIAFARGEFHHFLGEHEAALAPLEKAFSDAGFRRRFVHSLFPALAAELIHAGRLEEARRCARLVSAENGGDPYFLQLVEILSRGEPPAFSP